MSGGGGGGGVAVAPTYVDPVNGMTFTDPSVGYLGVDPNGPQKTGAQQLNDEITQRQAQEKATSDAAQAKVDAQKAKDESDFQTRFTTAKTQAGTNINDYFTQQGYDPHSYAAQIANAISTAAGNVQDLAPNPQAAFSPTMGASILADINSGVQSKARNSINSLFSPTYAADNVTSDWLTPAISSVLSTQFDPLTAQLVNALKRGTLNQQGYEAANAKLASDRTAATSTVNNLGSNILASDRTSIDNYITGAKNAASNVNANTYGAFDPTKYATGANGLVAQEKANFGGDLSNAIGSTSFSDLASLLNAGGAVQGANDPTATNPVANGPGGGPGNNVSDAYIAQQALAKSQRGLGSTGAF